MRYPVHHTTGTHINRCELFKMSLQLDRSYEIFDWHHEAMEQTYANTGFGHIPSVTDLVGFNLVKHLAG